MSVFTSLVTDVVPIPHDPPHTVTIRKLAPKHLQAARKAALMDSITEMKAIGGPAFVKELQSLTADDPEAVKREIAGRAQNPLRGVDTVTLLERGIVAWTYECERSRETFEDLDEPTMDLLATAILKLAKPDLFVTAEQAEGERKND
jgi:hypothetical protein